MRTKALGAIRLAFAVLTLSLLMAGNALATHTKEADSKFAFDETVSKVKAAIEAEGFTIVATVDLASVLQKEGAKKAPGMVMIEFLDPKQLKEAFDVDHASVIEMPWRLIIVEGAPDDPHSKYTHITYVKPASALAGYKKLRNQGKNWDAAIEKIIGTVKRAGTHGGH